MAHFFVDPSEIHPDFMLLTGENAVHAKVLRLKCGEKVTVSDGTGKECVCTVSDVSAGQISLVVDSVNESATEPSVRVCVYMAYAKGDKLEHVIQKATELGAAEIVAFPSVRCVSKPDDKAISKKLERWQKIAASAAEQSGRGKIPVVRTVTTYQTALVEAAKADVPILFYENEKATTLRMALKEAPYKSVSIMTGPEGGLDPSEVNKAMDAGLKICTLGSRILRCETAPLCALSAIMYDSGEF